MNEILTQTHTYLEMTPDRRPQDESLAGTGWKFETLEHGGEYPDCMPQAIRATDAEGRSCVYVPIKVSGKVVESLGFNTVPDDFDWAALQQLRKASP